MMVILNLTAEWDWENADPEPESYGYVTLRVGGHGVARIPMTFWNRVRQDEPSDAQVEEAVGEWLTDQLASGPVVRALAEEAKNQRELSKGTFDPEEVLDSQVHWRIAEALERIAKAADGRPSV